MHETCDKDCVIAFLQFIYLFIADSYFLSEINTRNSYWGHISPQLSCLK